MKSQETISTKQGNKYRRLVPLFVAAVLAFTTCFAPVFTRLTVSSYREERLLLSLPLQSGEQFKLRYTHSVNLSPVIDTIEWTGSKLMVREALFKTFGAGIPIPEDGIGKELVKTDGGYLLTGIDKPQDSFLLMTEEIPDHHLIYRDCEISLNSIDGIGSLLLFEVKKISLISCFTHDWRSG